MPEGIRWAIIARLLRYVLRRLVLTIPVLLGVATLVFLLIHLVPGDPAEAMLGETAPASDLAELRTKLGLDQPLAVQYGRFLTGLSRGEVPPFGRPIFELDLVVDSAVARYERIVFTVGRNDRSLLMTTADWLAAARPERVVPLT